MIPSRTRRTIFLRERKGRVHGFLRRESITVRKISSLSCWNFETATEIERFQARERFEGAVRLFFVLLNISQVFHQSSWRQNLVTRDARLASKERREIILDPSTGLSLILSSQLRLVSRRKERWLENTTRPGIGMAVSVAEKENCCFRLRSNSLLITLRDNETADFDVFLLKRFDSMIFIFSVYIRIIFFTLKSNYLIFARNWEYIR